MPIGDLLAEITGEKPTSASAAANRTSTTTGLKRKAESDSASNAIPNKAVRQSQSASRDVVARRPSPLPTRPSTVAKPTIPPTNGQRLGITSTAATSQNKPYTGTATPGRVTRKPETLSNLSSKKDSNDSSVRSGLKSGTLSAPKVAPAKPSPTTPTASGPTKPPKKGSFAEIMARGAKAQQIAPKAGVIQHKAIGQTVMSKREREEQKSKWKHGKIGSESRSSALPSRDKQAGGARNGTKELQPSGRGNGRPTSAGNDAPEKKIKKAAMASTGYTGTARPPPSKTLDPKSAKSAASRSRPAGGLLAPPRSGRRGRFQDDDSDMDDFIDDDGNDEEDDMPPRGYRYVDDYDSDSDMEANADDIYAEEQRALRQAREDDAKEEALLDKLKREKEARKKRGY